MLYHLSSTQVNNWGLRVPNSRIKNEDSCTKRICMSESIEGALSGIGVSVLRGLKLLNRKKNIPSVMRLYYIDDEKLICNKDFISNEMIVKYNLVPDAAITKEAWIINRKIQFKHKYIIINNFSIKYKKINNNYYDGIETIENLDFNFLPQNDNRVINSNIFWTQLLKIMNENSLNINYKTILSLCEEDREMIDFLGNFYHKCIKNKV